MNVQNWSRDETKELLRLVQQYETLNGRVQWDQIAEAIGKPRVSCQKKYLRVINFNTSDSERYHEWCDAEKDILMECVQIYGKDWEKIASRFFTWMTPLKLKNKHYALTKDKTRVQQPRSTGDSSSSQQQSISDSPRVPETKETDTLDDDAIYARIRQLLLAGAQ